MISSVRIAALSFTAVAGSALAQPFQYRAENGHWYRAVLVPERITWEEARLAAVAQHGTLACIEDAAENTFVFGLIDRPEFWFRPPNGAVRIAGPCLGGIQAPGSPEPADGFQWVDGSAWSYTNWADQQPDNAVQREDRVHFFALGLTREATWNDWWAGARVNGYVVEVDCVWILEQPLDRLVCPGSEARFTFNAGGTAPVVYQWRKNGVPISTASNPTARSMTLVIPVASEGDSASYDCVVTNPCESRGVVSRGAALVVCPPDINCDSFLDFFDYSDFVRCFQSGDCESRSADFNEDGFVDFFDYAAFVEAFEQGC